MNRLSYLFTKFFYIFFSFKAVIFKPKKTKSLRTLPTTFKIAKSTWFIFMLGAGVLLVGFFGGAFFGLELEPYSVYELWGFLAFEAILILAFVNQFLLKGEVYVSADKVIFSYRNILGRIYREEDISDYHCIWVQKYRTPGNLDNGSRYCAIYLRHKWNRFRTVCLYKGNHMEEKAGVYSDLFNLRSKKSIITIVK